MNGILPQLQSIAAGIGRRDRRVLAMSLTAIAARVVALAVTLATVRLGVQYLGAARYGLWMTVTSLTAFLSFSDLGIGNALINRMSRAFTSGERDWARKEISSASAMLTAAGAAVLIAGAALLPVLPWERIYKRHRQGASEAGPATFVVVACFTVLLPLALVQKVQLGFQEGAVSNLWTLAGNLLGFAFFLACIAMRLELL